MSLTLRNVKGSELTFTELDDNFTYLESLVTSSVGDLETVLGNGNITNGNDILITNNDIIRSQTGTSELKLEGNNNVTLGNDTQGLFMSQTGSVVSIANGVDKLITQSDVDDTLVYDTEKIRITLSQPPGDIGNKSHGELQVRNTIDDDCSTFNADNNGVFISTRNSTIEEGVVNTVVVGGNNILAEESDTLYCDKLNIKTIGSTTPVATLGIDASGRIVEATGGGSSDKYELLSFALGAEDVDVEMGIVLTYFIPFDEYTLEDLMMTVNEASINGDIELDILKNGTSIMSTYISIDENHNISDTASVPFDISTDTFVRGDKIQFEVKADGDSAKGLKIALIGKR